MLSGRDLIEDHIYEFYRGKVYCIVALLKSLNLHNNISFFEYADCARRMAKIRVDKAIQDRPIRVFILFLLAKFLFETVRSFHKAKLLISDIANFIVGIGR